MHSAFVESIARHLGPNIRIVREMGGAGMAHVFLADDVALGRQIVVKVLPPERAGTMSAERFRREIQTVAKLQHANIVPVLNAGEGEGVLWFTMPYVTGASLRDRLAQGGAMAPAEALTILRDVLRALAFAHKHGVLHRDIKPDNVLLAGGAAVVTDFGIAKAMSAAATLDPESSLTVAGSSLGTPRYMAPEQISGDPDLDHRADLYSFGVLAYEMLSGRTPFHDRPPPALLKAHLTETPAPLLDAAPGTSATVARLVMQCLQKSPGDRPQSADAILEMLDGATVSGSVATPPPPRAKSRVFRMAAVAVAGLTAVVAGVMWRGWGSQDGVPVDPSLIAIAPFRVAAPERSLDYLREGMLDIFAAKLPGEGGARATEPRAMLAAWQRATGTAAGELSHEDAVQVARSVGASRILLGEVVASGSKVDITIRILQTADASESFRASASGSADSIPALVDALSAKLLTDVNPRATSSATSLARVPLASLRAYLDGVRKLRALLPTPAVEDFRTALAGDSTFALAGIGLVMAADWYGDPPARKQGLDVAWKHQENLSDRDKLLLRALAGPEYPRVPTSPELLAARVAFSRAAPDNVDAAYLLGDMYFHEGYAIGERAPMEKARQGFERAMSLDSLYVPGYAHALEIAIMDGDDAAYERFARLRAAVDTGSGWRRIDEWFRASRRGDAKTAAKIWEYAGEGGHNFTILDYAVYTGIGIGDAPRAAEALVKTAGANPQLRAHYSVAFNTMMTVGQPRRAREILELSRTTYGGSVLSERELSVMTAMFGEGDTSDARRAIRDIDSVLAANRGTDSASLVSRRIHTLSRGLWRLFTGDTTGARRDLADLKSMAQLPASRGTYSPTLNAGLFSLEAWMATASKAPDAAVLRARFDSALVNLPYHNTSNARVAGLNLLAARLFEQSGQYEKALAAAGRRSMRRGGGQQPFYSVQAFETARLAALTGDTTHARKNYELFLTLRPAPDATGEAKNQEARRALEAFTRR